MKIVRPEPNPGLSGTHFKKICVNGFGDRYNSYAYSMAWFRDCLYVGTSRANLCLLKYSMPFVTIDQWPVECLHQNYSPEFEQQCARGEIWRYNPALTQWDRVYQAPLIRDEDGYEFSRDLGYRGMCVFQGKSDAAPALYVSTWSRSRGNGPDILRSEDGITFTVTPKIHFQTQERTITVNAIRSLLTFQGKLFTAPVGASKGQVNASGISLIYETQDPTTGEWVCVNEPGFGTLPEVMTVYELAVLEDYLYAGTAGLNGFQIWRTTADGKPPYKWEKVLGGGAGRGALNQGAASMVAFKGALYVGTGIQNGGHDRHNKIGPAAAEIIRIHPDKSWDIIVGNTRTEQQPSTEKANPNSVSLMSDVTAFGHPVNQRSLSGLKAGFDNFFAGYLWRMGVHDGWLYAGTMDWSVILQYVRLDHKPVQVARIIDQIGAETFVQQTGGASLWRTYDGENWLPVTKNGFNNPYNYGIRNIVSTPVGLFIGTANPFGPRMAIRSGKGWEWTYVDNPKGGLEVLQGSLS